MQSFAQDLYGQAGGAEGAGPDMGAAAAGDSAGTDEKKPENDAVDADFEVVDDDEKKD
jgi:hypothetical protein